VLQFLSGMGWSARKSAFFSGLSPGAAARAAALAIFLPLCGVLLAELVLDLLLQREALAGVLSAAALGAAGYVAGQWVGLRLSAWPGPSGGLNSALWRIAGGEPRGEAAGEDWPVLAMLLFAPIVILFSGLGGWV
jgi:hypothetical protein